MLNVRAGIHSPPSFPPICTKAGDVAVHADVFEAPLCRLRLYGVALAHVVHGEHVLLAELGVVVKVDLGIEANHWEDGGAERR